MIVTKEKFVGYADILGYSSLTREAAAAKNFSYDQLHELTHILKAGSNFASIKKYGPTICPGAVSMSPHLNFEVTQAWDSVVVTAEVSPAGVINLVYHFWLVCINLLSKGVLCRGFISRGEVFHEGDQLYGPGHVDTVQKEKSITFRRMFPEEKGTPFIEIENSVINYVRTETDDCVREMFDRFVLCENEVTAIFPIKRLAGRSWEGGPQTKEEHLNMIEIERKDIQSLKGKIMMHTEKCDAQALQKCNHYFKALNDELARCDLSIQQVEAMYQPYGIRMTKENCPGFFMD